MVAWPSQFCPLINTLQESPPQNTIRSDMDVGPAKVRRRTTANIRPIAFRLYLSPSDVSVMDYFYTNSTVSGVEPFDFIHPRTKESVQARFTEPPQYSNRSRGYDVSVSLEILP